MINTLAGAVPFLSWSVLFIFIGLPMLNRDFLLMAEQAAGLSEAEHGFAFRLLATMAAVMLVHLFSILLARHFSIRAVNRQVLTPTRAYL